MTNGEQLDAQIVLVRLLENSISELNAEYRTLEYEIGSLLLAKAKLEDERAAELVSGATTGQ